MTFKHQKTQIALAVTLSLATGMVGTSGAYEPSPSAVLPTSTAANAVSRAVVLHKTVKIDGLDIFYREAGSKDAPTVLLLHGFPTSSHMFRNLIPALADRYHVVAKVATATFSKGTQCHETRN